MIDYKPSESFKCNIAHVGWKWYPYKQIQLPGFGQRKIDIILVLETGVRIGTHLVFVPSRFDSFSNERAKVKIEDNIFYVYQGETVKYRGRAIDIATVRGWTRSAMPEFHPESPWCQLWMDNNIPDWREWEILDGRKNEVMEYAFAAEQAFLFFYTRALVE